MSEPISERETYETATHEENVETILWLLGVNRKWQERAERAEEAHKRLDLAIDRWLVNNPSKFLSDARKDAQQALEASNE